MEIGDRVIINPNVPDNAWSKNGYGFYYSTMRKPGIFVLEKEDPRGGFVIDGYIYDEEWLLPVPLFKAGDSVTIREDLKESMSCPYGITDGMVNLKGMQFNVEKVQLGNRAGRDIEILGDDGCLYNINGPGSRFSWSSPMFDLSNYKFKIKSNESRLQEQESPLRRGSREFTGGVRCRVNKARVTVSSPGYKEVIGRG
jgi:hypothetical protein